MKAKCCKAVKAFLIVTFVCAFANADVETESVYSFKLNRADSLTFSAITKSFSGPKENKDPEYPAIVYKKYWYQSPSRALTMGCRHTYSGEKEIAAECDFDFSPSRSTNDTEVLVLAHGIIRVTITDKDAATKIYKSLEMSPYTSNEWVRVFVADKPEDKPRVKVQCEPTSPRATTARKCVLDVVLN